MVRFTECFPENVSGEFFVDTTCTDCDTCRQLAPVTFEDGGEHSFVYAQPHTTEQWRKALRALLACPTGSIGTQHTSNAKEVMADFPLHLEDEVYYSGVNSPKSYGGYSYFVQHPHGYWFIDSPKYLPHLMQRFEALGGIRYIFLTHRDAVAEAHKYAKQFGSQPLSIAPNYQRSRMPRSSSRAMNPWNSPKGLRLFRRPVIHRGTVCYSTSSVSCSAEITCGGIEFNSAWGPRGNIAGIRGPSKRNRCRGCGISPLIGCSQAMDSGSTFPVTSCKRSWQRWSNGCKRWLIDL